MRSLINITAILLICPSVVFASKKCKGLDAKVQKALEAQRIMTDRGIRAGLRKELTKAIDDGVDIHPMFFQQVIQAKGFPVKGFKDKKLMVSHARKHGGEFDIKSQKAYLREAEKFALSRQESIMTFRSKNDIYRYNPQTNEFLVIERSGKVIGTYYKPDLKKINDARKRNDQAPFSNVTEWFIKNKWERFVLNNNFKK